MDKLLIADLCVVAEKHGYIRLNWEEAQQSQATHQAKSMYNAGERFALTLLINEVGWLSRNHRGDWEEYGSYASELDRHLLTLADHPEPGIYSIKRPTAGDRQPRD